MWFVVALLALRLAPVSPTAPNRQPQLTAANGMVALVFGAGESVWFTRSADNGKSFTKPSKVADLPKLMLGRHRGPRVAIAGNSIVITAISSASGDLYAWRSTDAGSTWSKPAVVNDVPKASEEGLHALAADAEGHLALAWLDDRNAPGKRLYGAFSNDGGATWSKNALLYQSPERTICECCHPSLAALGHGEFAVMWRNALDGSRDFYTLHLRDGKPVTAAAKIGEGTWKLNACPMDGGGIAVENGAVTSAWRRDKDVYLAEPGKPERKIAAGQDVALAVNAKGAYAVWSTPQGIEALPPGAASPARLSEAGAFPTAAALPDGSVLAAWEENGAISMGQIKSAAK
jgi:hypothetical protein